MTSQKAKSTGSNRPAKRIVVEKTKNGRSLADQYSNSIDSIHYQGHENNDPWDREASIQSALLDAEEKSGLVARSGNKIVGAVSYTTIEGRRFYEYYTDGTRTPSLVPEQALYVRHLGSVLPGVGSTLLKEVESLADKEGLQVILNCTLTSRGFYERKGYTCRGTVCSKTPPSCRMVMSE